MTDPTPEFEVALEARVRAHLDSAIAGVDVPAVAAAVMAETERAQPVGRPQVRWLATPPARWRPVAAIAALLSVALGAVLLGGSPNQPSPSPSPTSAVVAPSTGPSRVPASGAAVGLRRLNANGLLALSENGSIRVMAPDGSGAKALDGLPGDDQQPAWSPDGRWIAFLNGEGETLRLGRMLADGSAAEIITEVEPPAVLPTWSPDGAWIAWTQPGRGVSKIHVVHLATGRTSHVANGWDPDWSPDSRSLVVVHGRLMTTLSIIEIGGDARPLTGGGEPFTVDANPEWSPTGDRILFDRDVFDSDGRDSVLMVIQADGTDLRELLGPTDRGNDARPLVDPFGDRVAFDTTSGDNEPAGSIVGIDGSNVRRIGAAPRWWAAIWSPDGRFLVTGVSDDAQVDVNRWVIVNTDTGERAFGFEVTQSTVPSWQPLPYSVSCGPVDDARCRDLAIGIVANGMDQYPGKRVLRVEISATDGDYTLVFTDGTAIAADIN